MGQDATFKNELNLIEAEGRGVHEEVKLGIKTTNLDEDIVQVLAMLERTSSPPKFGHGVLEGRAGALRK
jgi:hypothetical protein